MQYSSKKNANLSDKFLRELYESWRKNAYGPPVSLAYRKPAGTKKVVLLMIQFDLERYWLGTSKKAIPSYEVKTLSIQKWHYKKTRIKKVNKIMSVLHLDSFPKTEYNQTFNKIIETGSF